MTSPSGDEVTFSWPFMYRSTFCCCKVDADGKTILLRRSWFEARPNGLEAKYCANSVRRKAPETRQSKGITFKYQRNFKEA